MVKSLFRLAFASIVVLAASTSAESYGQQVRRYQPSRPTVSPYLNLFRNNTGPLPNYYSLVRPELQQQRFNQQQMMLNVQQQSAMGLMENSIKQGTTPTGKRSGFMIFVRQGFQTNGGGATFMGP